LPGAQRQPYLATGNWQLETGNWKLATPSQFNPAEESMDTTARLRELSARVQGSLHDKPALWTGIATSAGFALGIAGRLMRRRTRRPLPAIIVISES
jgi:hypothetical protein